MMCLSLCILLLEMPEKICTCSPGTLSVNPGKVVAVVTINGKNKMNLGKPRVISIDFVNVS